MTQTAVAIQPITGTWTIDSTHSSVQFSVRHLMIATARGRFSSVSGTVALDEEHPSANAVAISIDAASLDTHDAQRDTHLRSADFFDVEHYPLVTFASTRVERTAPDAYTLVGDLTIRGIARPVTLVVAAEGRTTDPWGNDRVGFSATTTIRRSEFGLTWNQVLEAGGVAVGDEVKIAIDIELVRTK